MNKNKLELLGGTLTGMMFLSGCAPATETNKNQATESAPTPGNNAESPYVKYTPTVEATSLPMPTRPDMAGGAYSSEEQSLIEKGAFIEIEQAFTAWTKYWFHAENNPFPIETTDLHFKYVDINSESKSGGVCLESSAYRNVCFALPIVNGAVAEVPPIVSGEYTIPVGYGPLEMSLTMSADQVSVLKLDESLTNSVLGFDNRNWVRIKNGEVIATLDLESAQWVATPEAVEVVENEVIKGSIVCVAKEYCMAGQMEVDQEVAKVYYEKFLNALVHCQANEKYFNDLLNGNISLEALKTYLETNNGMLPAGLKLMRNKGSGVVKMDIVLDKPVNLSALKTMTFGSKEWKDDVYGIQEYIKKYNDIGLMNPHENLSYAWNYFGWYVDESGYLVLVCGSKDPYDYVSVLGGGDGVYNSEHDTKAATGMALSIIKIMEDYDSHLPGVHVIPFDFDKTAKSGAQEKDIDRILDGKYLYK